MSVENYNPVFADFEELQVLFQSFDELVDAALDSKSGARKDSALWLISKCSALAARDIGFLVSEKMALDRALRDAAEDEINDLRMKLEEWDTK